MLDMLYAAVFTYLPLLALFLFGIYFGVYLGSPVHTARFRYYSVVRRRDKHASDLIRKLRKTNRNLRAELARSTAGNQARWVAVSAARNQARWVAVSAARNQARADRVALQRIQRSLERGIDTSKALQENDWHRTVLERLYTHASSNRIGRNYEQRLDLIASICRRYLDHPYEPVDTSDDELLASASEPAPAGPDPLTLARIAAQPGWPASETQV